MFVRVSENKKKKKKKREKDEEKTRGRCLIVTVMGRLEGVIGWEVVLLGG